MSDVEKIGVKGSMILLRSAIGQLYHAHEQIESRFKALDEALERAESEKNKTELNEIKDENKC